MRILGIDFGKSKVGLAMYNDSLPYPFGVLRFRSEKGLLEKISKIVEKEKIEKVVVGVSEGKMGQESAFFARELEKNLSVPVVLQDETLTTHDAKFLSIVAGIGRKKRREMEDAYAACLILENYVNTRG